MSPIQSAFVSGRKGVENAIIMQEIIHTISKKKGGVGYWQSKWILKRHMTNSNGALLEKHF